MIKRTQGFTLVELIVVIGILAIFAAWAYPRFVDMETQARKALVLSLRGAVQASASLAHSLWIARGYPATVDMEGNIITMINGYPAEGSIDDTLMDYSGFQFVNAVTARFRKQGAPAPNTCMVTYADAPAGGKPAITAFTSGC